jgi:hypothetical protein
MGRLKSDNPMPKAELFGFGGVSNTFSGRRNENRKTNGQFAKKRVIKRAAKVFPTKEATPILMEIAGARMIDLGHLQKQMVCSKCQNELSIRAIFDETHLGLASILRIKCHICDFSNKVQTSKLNPEGSYNINVSAVLGNYSLFFSIKLSNYFITNLNLPKNLKTKHIILRHLSKLKVLNLYIKTGSHDAGFGNTQMRAFLSTMNAPSMTLSSFEKIERRIGPRTIELAENSCKQAILAERDCSMRQFMQNYYFS